MLGTSNVPVYHRGKVTKVLLQVLEILFPGVTSPDLKYSNLHVNVLEHFGMFTDLKSTQFVYLLITQRLLGFIETGQCISKFLFAPNLWVVQSTIEHNSDFMRRGRLCASFKVGFEELYTLLMIEETSILIKLVHLFTQLDEHVDLTRFRIEVELGLAQTYDSCQGLLVFFGEQGSNCISDSHELQGLVLVNCLAIKILLYFPHVPSRYQLVSECNLYSIHNVRMNRRCTWLIGLYRNFVDSIWITYLVSLVWSYYL